MRELPGRLWRHLRAPRVGRWLSEAALQRLAHQVAAGESQHSGEIRICVESRLPNSYLMRQEPMRKIVRERAVAQFGKLKVWDTEHNNGVLIYLLTAERAIDVVADRGACAKISPPQWQGVVRQLEQHLRLGQFEAGLMQAVNEVSVLLQQHFPLAAGRLNPNELNDRPVLDGKGS